MRKRHILDVFIGNNACAIEIREFVEIKRLIGTRSPISVISGCSLHGNRRLHENQSLPLSGPEARSAPAVRHFREKEGETFAISVQCQSLIVKV